MKKDVTPSYEATLIGMIGNKSNATKKANSPVQTKGTVGDAYGRNKDAIEMSGFCAIPPHVREELGFRK